MFRNYLKIAFRSLWRTKVHSLINILGLGLGIGCCVLISLFVRDEWTYDTFHSKADRIFRVWAKEDWGINQQFFNTVTPFPMGPALQNQFQEVEHQVRIHKIGTQVKVGETHYSETLTFGGRDLFNVFDFSVILGNGEEALNSQSGIVINQYTAKKYFGDTNPIEKIISVQIGEKFEEFAVKAVIANIPANSSIRFYLLVSDLNYPRLYNDETINSAWFNVTPETYVLIRDGVDADALERKFPFLFRSVLGEDDYTKSKYTAGLQPLTSIHLDNNFPAGLSDVSDPKYAYLLAGIALLILTVACINFVTLSVGRSLKRAKEVGIRKVAGAERSQLMLQFIGEAFTVTLIAMCLGVVLSVLCLPLFNDLSGKKLAMGVDGFSVMMGLSLLIIIGLIAGSYPAFVLSGFRPIAILKGKLQTGNSKQTFRKVLVGLQLVLSIFLISSTLVMRNQLNFLRDKNLGFNREQVAVVQLNVPRGGRMTERVKAGFVKAEVFKAELLKIPDVISVCASSHDFGSGGWTNIGYTDDLGTYRTFNVNIVDEAYIPTLNMEFAAGRNFVADNPSDIRRAVIVNEAFAKEYGWNDPVGKKIPGKDFADHEIIGVVKDFNYESLYTRVTPLVIVMDASIPLSGSENVNIGYSPVPKLMIRLRPGNLSATVRQVNDVWDRLTDGEEFVFSFVDETLAQQYRNDLNLGRIVSIATLLAVVIGSLGLYALASLAMQNRTKEISIRKVMGANEQSLLLLLSKDYVLLILVSLLLSVPFTWLLMNNWLQTFEYRVAVGWEVFAVAGILSLIIALVTISYQAIKTAWSRPAETLKCE